MKRYKATAVVQWEFELGENEQNPFRFAHDEISKMLSGDFSIRIAKVDKCKKRGRAHMILGEFSPEDVLPYITSADDKREYEVNGKAHLVRMNSHRYFVFRSSRKCAACGLEGTKMLLEQHPNDKSPHFNLYAEEDSQLVLMTKDHIYAKSLGGEDRHSNYQTMCSICNNLKASSHLTLDAILQLRELYNKNRNKLSKKKLAALISETRSTLETSPPTEDNGSHPKNCVMVTTDISVLKKSDGSLVGVPLYESVDEDGVEALACIRNGTLIDFVDQENDQLICPFNEGSFLLYKGLTDFSLS
jgi:hypothetical protein